MTSDRASLLAIAERIAEAENRVAQLRERVEQLKFEEATHRKRRTHCKSSRATWETCMFGSL